MGVSFVFWGRKRRLSDQHYHSVAHAIDIIPVQRIHGMGDQFSAYLYRGFQAFAPGQIQVPVCLPGVGQEKIVFLHLDAVAAQGLENLVQLSEEKSELPADGV